MENNCPFCNIDKMQVEIIYEDDYVMAIYDSNPVNLGHTLIIPKKHISNYFDLTIEEQQQMWDIVNKCKSIIQKIYSPDGYNIGINIGKLAGQTVQHVHIHLIPRYKGDVENPRGGVRGAIPDKQNY